MPIHAHTIHAFRDEMEKEAFLRQIVGGARKAVSGAWTGARRLVSGAGAPAATEAVSGVRRIAPRAIPQPSAGAQALLRRPPPVSPVGAGGQAASAEMVTGAHRPVARAARKAQESADTVAGQFWSRGQTAQMAPVRPLAATQPMPAAQRTLAPGPHLPAATPRAPKGQRGGGIREYAQGRAFDAPTYRRDLVFERGSQLSPIQHSARRAESVKRRVRTTGQRTPAIPVGAERAQLFANAPQLNPAPIAGTYMGKAAAFKPRTLAEFGRFIRESKRVVPKPTTMRSKYERLQQEAREALLARAHK